MTLTVVMLGDVVGHSGRMALAQQLPTIKQRYSPDLVLANGENVCRGSGITPELYTKLIAAGVDGITLGDHVYKKQQIAPVLEREANICRPANLPAGAAGRPWMRLRLGGDESRPWFYVVTILGRVFGGMPIDEPFACIDRVLAELPEAEPMVLVEIHAEATSEKKAMGWRLDGRVAAVVGTHTHVPTADARVLPRGTAYITDLGMCGPEESVLGRKIEPVLHHMTTGMHAPFDVAEGDPRVNGVAIRIDPQSRRALSIERIELPADVGAPPFVA